MQKTLVAALFLAAFAGSTRAAENLGKTETESDAVEIFAFRDALSRKAVDSSPLDPQLPPFAPEQNNTAPSVEFKLTPLPEVLPLPEVAPIEQPVQQIALEAGEPVEEPGLFIIPPSPQCENPGGKSVLGVGDELFRPLTAVKLAGRSSEPQRTSGEDVTLDIPENVACNYLGQGATHAYLTPPLLCATSPYRSAYPFCHNPLYFDDPNLENCGRGWRCFTSGRSSVLFLGQTAMLPLHMLIDCPRDHVRALPDCPSCHRFKLDAYCPAFRCCR